MSIRSVVAVKRTAEDAELDDYDPEDLNAVFNVKGRSIVGKLQNGSYGHFIKAVAVVEEQIPRGTFTLPRVVVSRCGIWWSVQELAHYQ